MAGCMGNQTSPIQFNFITYGISIIGTRKNMQDSPKLFEPYTTYN